MKLVQILASIVTGFAILATVGSASASAAEFNLSGTFAPTDASGTTGLAGGSFNGTFSYSGGAILAGSYEPLSSFSINLLSISNNVVDTFSSNADDYAAIFSADGNLDYDTLAFIHIIDENYTNLALTFPIGFQGAGNLTMSNIFESSYNSNSDVIHVTSAISQAVPEPSPIVGTLAAGAALIVIELKKSKKRKAFQAA